MSKFGFAIKKDSILELDKANLSLSTFLKEQYPAYKTCINCGICSAVCTAAQLTAFNIRSIKLKIDRGDIANLAPELVLCMLCGKCEMACPRGISNRRITLLINQYLKDNNG